MGIKIPKEITTAQDKMAYSLRLVEKLRLEHNAKGALVRIPPVPEGGEPAFAGSGQELSGGTDTSNITPPDEEGTITLAEFREWQSKVFEPVQEEALMYANEAKQAMYQDKKWDAQIDAKGVLDAKEAEVRK